MPKFKRKRNTVEAYQWSRHDQDVALGRIKGEIFPLDDWPDWLAEIHNVNRIVFFDDNNARFWYAPPGNVPVRVRGGKFHYPHVGDWIVRYPDGVIVVWEQTAFSLYFEQVDDDEDQA